jgi:hypothetical protein
MIDQQVSNRSATGDLAVRRFMEAIRNDPRITPYHVSLFLAIAHFRGCGGSGDRMCAFSHELMPLAKISSGATYHKCVRELSDYGYIRYTPSYNRFEGSFIELRP